MKVSFIKILIILFLYPFLSYSQVTTTPQELGLKIKHGHIDINSMTKTQKDTIVFGYFNFEDWFEDIAIYYKSKDEIKIFLNQGNGSAKEWRGIKTSGEQIKSIESCPPDSFIYNPNRRWDLKINYSNGTNKIIKNRKIINPDYTENKIPYRDIFEDSKGPFVYDITFIQQWLSDRNGEPVNDVEVGDIDRDGKNEAIYTFWPLNGNYYPTHLVVFEYVNENQYRIDWDSVYAQGGFYNLNFPLTDFDKDGNKEFIGMGRDPLTGYIRLGVYECYGPGIYKYICFGFTYNSFPFSMDIRDSITALGMTRRGMWIGYSNSYSPYNTEFIKYMFMNKSTYRYQFYDLADFQGGDYFVYSIAVGDIDNDGKEEIVEGSTQWSSDYIGYWDSTGVNTNDGYEYKEINPNAPVSGGYLIGKNLAGDGNKEIIACGIGYGTGSIGVVKHTGSPGANQFTTMWWDSTGIFAMPNFGIDTGSIDYKFSILYPTYGVFGPNLAERLYLITYTKDSIYSFNQSCNLVKDSMCFLGPKFWDMNNNGKMHIIAPIAINDSPPSSKFYLSDWEQSGTIGIKQISSEIPKEYKLYQNYPNPFNPVTKISYSIPKPGLVKITVYNILGQEVKVLVNEFKKEGNYLVEFNGSSLSSGIYFYRIQAGNFIQTKRMVLIK